MGVLTSLRYLDEVLKPMIQPSAAAMDYGRRWA